MTTLKRLRLKKGLTMKQVSKRIGKTEACVSHYETGRRKIPVATAKVLADMYGCDWPELYEDGNDGKTAVS